MAPVAQELDTTDTESLVGGTESDESEKASVKEVHVTFKLPESTKDDEVGIGFVKKVIF